MSVDHIIVLVLCIIVFIILIDCIRKELHMLFGKKKEKKVMEDVNKINESTREESKVEETKPVEEWIWVTGYKGTDKDMKCRDYQYTLGELHNMPNDSDIKECESGFHLCKTLKDVFKYYDICDGHRFFKVRALVRKDHYERYGKVTEEYEEHVRLGRSAYGFTPHFWGQNIYDKMVARSIIFEQELTPDEIFAATKYDIASWDDKYKQLAMKIGIEPASDYIRKDTLVELGYSDTFARIIIDMKKYDIAMSVGSQPDLSMDMKCWLIFK